MSIQINLGAWNSVFAVPSKVVDEGLKFSDGVKLKVLLYVLRNCGNIIDDNSISNATGVNVTDIPEVLDYWVSMGLFQRNNNVFTPIQNSVTENNADSTNNNRTYNSVAELNNTDVSEQTAFTSHISQSADEIANAAGETKKRFALIKPQKPDYEYTAQMLVSDEDFKILVEETQVALGKTLSNSDCSTLLMLKDYCGLPLDVILMIINYCVSIDKPNMRTIERVGISWADDGIDSVEAADAKISRTEQINKYFSIVSSVFGLQNVGSPTKNQKEYSVRWIEEWKFSPEMLREAYERCVDKKGTVKFSYIDGILKRWNSSNIRTLEELKKFESKPSKPNNSDSSGNSSYNIDELDKINVLG